MNMDIFSNLIEASLPVFQLITKHTKQCQI